MSATGCDRLLVPSTIVAQPAARNRHLNVAVEYAIVELTGWHVIANRLGLATLPTAASAMRCRRQNFDHGTMDVDHAVDKCRSISHPLAQVRRLDQRRDRRGVRRRGRRAEEALACRLRSRLPAPIRPRRNQTPSAAVKSGFASVCTAESRRRRRTAGGPSELNGSTALAAVNGSDTDRVRSYVRRAGCRDAERIERRGGGVAVRGPGGGVDNRRFASTQEAIGAQKPNHDDAKAGDVAEDAKIRRIVVPS